MKTSHLRPGETASHSKNTSLTRKLIPGLLFGLLVFVGLILVGDIRQVSDEVRGFPWLIIPFVLGLTLWNYLLRFI